jgi:hypothetical protein
LTLDHLPKKSTVVIDASDTVYIDYDVLEIIREFEKIIAPQKHIQVALKGFKEEYNINNSDHVHDIIEKTGIGKKKKKPADELISEITE